MSGGGGSQTVTQKNDPPAWQIPYLQYGAREAQNIYSQGAPEYYPGATVVPFSPQTEAALGMQTNRALQGSATTGAAKNYAQDVLKGNYLNANPYLDATFNQAATATRSALDSQFAGSGRNIDQSYAARADQLNGLANQIYYQNYNDERQRQQGIVPFVTQLDNQDYTDISQLANVGSQVENLAGNYMEDAANRYNYNANAQSNSLDQYLGRVNGNWGGTSTSTQPVYRNTMGNVAGGAMTGYSAGSMLGGAANGASFGGWGALIGAALGGLLG